MKKIAAAITGLGFILFSASPIWAADVSIVISKPATVQITNLGKLLGSLVGVVLILAALAAFFFLIYGGISWIISGGDKSKVETAQKRIQAALLGLIIVFAVWALFTVVANWLGFDPFNLTLPTPTGN